MHTTYLSLKWTVSRARDTYGYNVVTLTDSVTGKRYRASGGGYDMTGTVFGEWLQDVHQDELIGIAHRAGGMYFEREDGSYEHENWRPATESLYGMTQHNDRSAIPSDAAKGFRRISVTLDGACGLESMRAIAEAIGLDVVTGEGDKRGNALGYIIGTGLDSAR